MNGGGLLGDTASIQHSAFSTQQSLPIDASEHVLVTSSIAVLMLLAVFKSG